MNLANNQMLSGSGMVKGAIIAASGSTIAPGAGFATLTFNGSLTLAAGSTNILKIGHTGMAHDSLAISGALTVGGQLVVTNAGGTTLAAGDTFQLFNAGSYSGTFAGVKLPALPFGLAWNTNALNTAGTLSVVLTTTPVIGTVSFSGSSLFLSGTGGVGNANYILLGTTNVAGGWTPLLTNQFDASGNFNFTTNTGSSTGQYFYRLQLQ